MSTITDITSHLESQGVGTRATDIFAGRLPNSPDNVVVVYEFQGRAPERVMGASLANPALRMPKIQVLVRNSSYAAAETKAQEVLDALDWFQGTINSTTYHLVEALQDFFSMGEDENKRSKLACNFQIHRGN